MPVMQTPRELDLPLPPVTGNELLDEYLTRLHRATLDAVSRIFDDLALGYSRRTILTAAPALGDLEEGQAVLVDGGGLLRIYYRLNSVLRFANLT